MSLLLMRRRRLSNIQIQKTGAGMAHQALSLRPLLIWSVRRSKAQMTTSAHLELIFGSSGLKIRAWPCLALGMASTMGRSFVGAVGGRVRMR
jgi:hypothetical protein